MSLKQCSILNLTSNYIIFQISDYALLLQFSYKGGQTTRQQPLLWSTVNGPKFGIYPSKHNQNGPWSIKILKFDVRHDYLAICKEFLTKMKFNTFQNHALEPPIGPISRPINGKEAITDLL